MTGLLDGYGIDMDEIEAPSFDVADDIYEFEVSDFFIQAGTTNWPDRSWIVIEFSLGGGGKSKSEWFELPVDASAPTDKELQKLGFYKNRLKDLGIEEADMNDIGPDDLIGLTGTLQVFTKNGYQNIKGVKLDDDGANEFAEKAPAKKAAPAAKKAPARKPVAAPVEQEEADEEEAEAEVEEEAAKPATRRPANRAQAATATARKAGVRENPFK